ncbi:MAG TPA: 5-formyltetrahydrofolate cyclo-ligase [Patescibacteria group bacterium]|nr:5-formyltetrahydrofolate cyclo-ligase [Patescibacteria group bacterium]
MLESIDMALAEQKRHLREKLLSQRLRLHKDEVKELSQDIASKLIDEINWEDIERLHIYIPIEKNNEVDTWYIIEFIQKNYPDIKIYAPKNNTFGNMSMDTILEPNNLGVLEPLEESTENIQTFDLVIAPMVGFDRRGHRLGYGGGYYDKFLSGYNCIKKIGISYSFCEAKQCPNEQHDQKLNTIITEKEVIKI